MINCIAESTFSRLRFSYPFSKDRLPEAVVELKRVDGLRFVAKGGRMRVLSGLMFWEGFGDTPASGIVDFLKRISAGKPLQVADAPSGGDPATLEILRQCQILEQSFEYLRQECGAGLEK